MIAGKGAFRNTEKKLFSFKAIALLYSKFPVCHYFILYTAFCQERFINMMKWGS